MLNFTILIFLTAIVFGALWLSAKFLGKTGLYVFAGINLILCSYYPVNIFMSISLFSAFVEVPIVSIIALFLTICLIYKKYGLSEGIKLASVLVAISLFNTLFGFVVSLYSGATFSLAFDATFLTFFISIFAFALSLGLGFFISEHTKLFTRFNDSFKNFLIFCIILFANTFVFTMLGEIGLFTFGQMLLNTFVTFLVQVIIAGIIFVLPKKLLKINDNSNFENVLKNKIEEVVASTKKAVEKTTENQENEKEEVEEEQPEIIVEDKKE